MIQNLNCFTQNNLYYFLMSYTVRALNTDLRMAFQISSKSGFKTCVSKMFSDSLHLSKDYFKISPLPES